MQIIVNNWKVEPSLNGLVHRETGEIRRLGEFHFIMLETLVNHAGEVVSRDFLMSEVWKNRVVGNNSLLTAVYALRVALGDDGRVQEIIKTIPKKGYLLNKDFIVLLPDEPLPAPQALTQPDPEPVADVTDALPASAPAPRNKHRLIVLAALLLLLGCGLIWLIYPGGQNSAPLATSRLSIKEELAPQNDKIKLFRLHRTGVNTSGAVLSSHIAESLEGINMLLTAHKATLTIYYYGAVQKMSVILLVQNQCGKEYQLLMEIRSWQQDVKKLGQLIHKETERTLNEMPACS
ncbi:transcriptional regulator [Enterobacter sp.]|uniref:winged helix-turn-helix domain-containing protein n=1 Tax=Enterobacter sp. TaxID=42895 RepID=UPI00296EFAFE|nr:transcriptional regulator [Enterobacter sp.]